MIMGKMMNKRVIIIGGEGNGGIIASCIEDNRKKYNKLEWKVEGFLNDFEKGKKINGYPVLGGTDSISDFLKEEYYFMYAIHMIGRNVKSEEIFNRMSIPKERFAQIIHHSAFVAGNATLEPGVFIMAHSYVGPKTVLGCCTHLMANSMIGHNTIVGPLCHFSLGSVTGSYVTMGKASVVAMGARVLERISIGNYAVAGANALITKDIPDYEIHIGSPAKFYRKVSLD
jgi:sugar O-acyltransferase (sialic acid O-acetyltransferase NeuD family)